MCIRDRYQAIHYELVASAKAVQLAHSIDPEYKVGSMILAVTIYPLTPNPCLLYTSPISCPAMRS